jgi:broad specificity phosphatase PhoE
MQLRVFQELERVVAAKPGKTVVVFTHGGPCKAAVFAALGLPPAQWRNWISDNASIQRLIWDGALITRKRSPWKLAGFNDTAHLRETDKIGDQASHIHTDKVV